MSEILLPPEAKDNIADFLLAYGGPWHLSIDDPKGFATRTFDDANAAAEWASRVNAKRQNVWFHVNPLSTRDRRGKEATVTEVRYLHVDVDPPKRIKPPEGLSAADLEAWRPTPQDWKEAAGEIAKKLVPNKLKQHGIPRPTFVNFSGGGFQAFWRLEEPIPVNGDSEKIEQIKAYNKRLAILLDGDKCHSLDHLMRLPGTVNWKEGHGREPTLARVWSDERECAYGLDAFKPHSEEPKPVAAVDLGNPAKFNAEDYELEDLANKLIAGEGLDEYPSRSEALFALLTSLARSGVPANAAQGFLLGNPGLKVVAPIYCDKDGTAYSKARVASNVRDNVKSAYEKATARKGGSVIMVATVNLAKVVEEAGQALAKCPDLFLRGEQVVRITKAGDCGDAIQRDPNADVISPVTAAVLRIVASRNKIMFAEGFDKKEGKWDYIQPPALVMKDVLSVATEFPFRPLRGVQHTPTLTRNEPGYDEAAKVLLTFSADRFEGLPMQPTEDDARTALALLREPLREYLWADPFAEAVVLSAMLSTTLRATMRTCPGFGFSAFQRGSGKTKLASIVGLIGTGHEPSVATFGPNDEENTKAITAAMLQGDQAVLFDNIRCVVANTLMEGALTSPSVKVRPLGVSQIIELPSRAMWLFTGNNLSPGTDMARRMLICRVRTDCERPEEKTFSFDPVAMVRERRDDFVRAAITVLRWGGEAQLVPFGSFEDFDVVRRPLVALGIGDPIAALDVGREADPERETRFFVIKELAKAFGRDRFRSADIVRRGEDVFPELAGIATGWKAGKITWALKAKAIVGVPLGGLTLEAETDSSAVTWYRFVGDADPAVWLDSLTPDPVECPF